MKPSFYFDHKWSNGKLVSSIKVEELLDADRDLYCIMALIDSEDDLRWYWINPDQEFTGSDSDYAELDRYRASYAVKTMYDRLMMEKFHIGDCCGIDCACTRCVTEKAYLKSLDIIKSTNIQGIELIAIVMAYEGKFLERNHYADLYCKSRLEQNPTEKAHTAALKLFPMPSGSMDSRLAYWDFIDPIHQNYYRNRALVFRKYFDHPELLSDITWG